ncbi:unnamed protein product [Cylindrotheca closterium]|uniref:Uncharacterized protein n=1 Tax=Cylindrotheca closterium TaxID=2856 RepID=A0AAD2CV18_9STRA|nr:unnamed protein product [Cylindrotheca closterium]
MPNWLSISSPLLISTQSRIKQPKTSGHCEFLQCKFHCRTLSCSLALMNLRKNQNNNQFFDRDKSDPRLRLENPFVGFWLICSEMFDYPWATTFDNDYYNELPLSIIRGIKQKRLASFQSFFRPESLTHHIQHAIQKISDPMNDNLDNAVGQSHSNKTTLVDQRKRHCNLTNNRYDALVDDDESMENTDNAEAADDDATTIDGNAYQQPNQDDDDNEILVMEVQNNPRRPPLSSDDEDDGDDEDEDDDDDNEDYDAGSNAGVVQSEYLEALVRSEDDNMAVDSLTRKTQVSQDSSSLINTPPPTRRILPLPTLAEKLNKFIQVNLQMSYF